jgi:hypothetical protein
MFEEKSTNSIIRTSREITVPEQFSALPRTLSGQPKQVEK